MLDDCGILFLACHVDLYTLVSLWRMGESNMTKFEVFGPDTNVSGGVEARRIACLKRA